MLVKNLLLIVLILLSNEDDRSLLQSQRIVLWVVAEKHTQIALRTCSEEETIAYSKAFRLLCIIEIPQWVYGPGAICPPGNALV